MAHTIRVKLNNPALLTWARESAGYSVDDLAAYMKKPVDTIRRWETGVEAPTYRQLQAFAKKVARPVAVLYFATPPQDPPRPPDYRVLPGTDRGKFSPPSLLAFRILRNSLADLRDVLTSLGETAEMSLPRFTTEEDTASQAANLREFLGVSFETQMRWRGRYEPLTAWRRALFERGVLVQTFDVKLNDLRAFSEMESGLGGIGLSTNDSPRGRVFSLFHEVAHLCLRSPGVSGDLAPPGRAVPPDVLAIERYCDQFAADFLLPISEPAVAESLRELARGLSRQAAQAYAEQFSVSKYVIARRMFDLNMLSVDNYWNQIEEWRRYDASEAQRLADEGERSGGSHWVIRVSKLGRPYVTKVLEAMDRGAISIHTASQILAVKPDRLDTLRAGAG